MAAAPDYSPTTAANWTGNQHPQRSTTETTRTTTRSSHARKLRSAAVLHKQRRGDRGLRQCPDQSALNLLLHQSGIDDAPAIDCCDQPVDLDPLVAADACGRDQADVRPECRRTGHPHRASRTTSIPPCEARSALKAAGEPPVPAEHRHAERQRLHARRTRQLVDEALGEEGQLALWRSASVCGW